MASFKHEIYAVFFAFSLFSTTLPSPADADSINPQLFGQCVWDGTHDVAPCIQAAINSAALKSGIVHIPHGTWELGQAVAIAANVTIEGDSEGTILKPAAGNQSNPVLLKGDWKAANVLVKGIAFDGGGQDYIESYPVIAVTTGASVVFDGVTVQNTNGIGLLLQGGTHHSGVRNSVFVNLGNHWKTTLQRKDRIQGLVFCCGKGNKNNFSIGNYFKDIGLDALQISDQNGFVATDNNLDLENDQRALVSSPDYAAGIFLMYSRNVTIARNVIHSAQGNGIDAPGLQHSTISNNTIADSGCAGIGLFLGYDKKTQTTGVLVSDNNIADSGRWNACTFKCGIVISGGTAVDVTSSHNTVTNTRPDKAASPCGHASIIVVKKKGTSHGFNPLTRASCGEPGT